jgi:hypothetical protein
LRASLELFLRAEHALLDREIICWMKTGMLSPSCCSAAAPRFCDFDLLWLNGQSAAAALTDA